jgi:acetylornithine deacetylase
LADVRKIKLPVDELLGPSTLNIGTISGGRAPNIIPDEARAEILIRLVGNSASTKDAMRNAAGGRVAVNEVLEIPALRLGSLAGMETTVVAYTTDIPAFGTAWGQPFLFGPGSINVAHTLEERVPKRQLLDAVEIYQRMVQDLWKRE